MRIFFTMTLFLRQSRHRINAGSNFFSFNALKIPLHFLESIVAI